MKVLFIDNTPSMGGSVHTCAELANGLAAGGAQVAVAASRPDLFAPLLSAQVAALPVAWEGFRDVFAPEHGLFSGLPLIGQALALRRFAKRLAPAIEKLLADFAPDLVHLNNLNLPALPVGEIVKRAGLPLAVHCQMIRSFSRRELRLAVLADRVLCVSEAVRRQLLAQQELAPEAAQVLYIPVDERLLTVEAEPTVREELGLTPEAPVAVMLGRLTAWKGQHVAIAAWRSVRQYFPEAALLLVGEGETSYHEQCKALIARLGIQESVRLLGHRNDVDRLLSAADLVIHASCYDRPEQGTVEAFGLVVAEAMAAGKPIVATDAGGVPEVIGDSAAGKLVRPGDPEAMATAAMFYLRDADARVEAGFAGRRRVRQTFIRERIIERLREIYAGMLSGSNTN